ncbi:heterokaryon incompatibility protein-domain-containing protein [Podospora didyma]|uniref:Heterokaryon incompatibility protein-domain-containing protein n=1 Tax=Podospora didyma TaxID=330526 RepID=A0AAE0NBE5_9PEZI|nr:heterokaryon incompatibility protein-domain-containing protein [Podospora didyma]
MALLNTNEILQLNNNVHTFVLVRPNQVDIEDVDLFVVQPPAAPLDPAHRLPTKSMTHLCDTCRSALEYFSFCLNSGPQKDDDTKLPASCLLHEGATTLQEGEDERCHLCILLMANLRIKRLAMQSIDQSNIEMCWQQAGRGENPKPARLHFALTHRGHDRSTNNYWNILKLHLWTDDEFDESLLWPGDWKPSEGRPALERHPSTESVQTRDNALAWLARCEADEDGKHDQCNRQVSGEWMPTRLLDVTTAIQTETLKLIAPDENPEELVSDRRYVTLSHCWGAWGGGGELPVLTTDNLAERLTTGIPLLELPQTFQDAVQIAHWFKVRWLWIDSLCILQDSADDWSREAIMMYDVYKNALLNISADDSPDARFGCFRNRDPLAVLPMQSDDNNDSGNPVTTTTTTNCWIVPDTNAAFEGVIDSPLAKRGWVFQERQLSRRVLHFTSTELIWECCASSPYFASEMFPGASATVTTKPVYKTVFGGKPKFQTQTTNLSSTSTPDKLYATWSTLCREYSAKKFTYPHDKLVALSGLAQEFQASLFPDDTYMAGLWRSTLPSSLLWQSSNTSSRIDHTEEWEGKYIAPSWSWLSINGAISPGPFSSSSQRTFSLVNILNVDIVPSIPSKPTASLQSASIKLACYLRRVEVRPDYEKKPWYLMAIGGGKSHKLIIMDDEYGQEETGGVIDNFHSDAFDHSFDVASDGDSGPEVVAGFFLPLCVSLPDETSGLCLSGLLVEPVGGEDGDGNGETFRRVGVLRVYGLHCRWIKYKAAVQLGGAATEEGDWESLAKVLTPSHESWDKLKKDDEDDVEEAGSESVVDDEIVGVLSDKKPKELEAADNKKGNQKAVELDLTPLDALERLYALDKTLLDGSELEARFEKMVPQRITLI